MGDLAILSRTSSRWGFTHFELTLTGGREPEGASGRTLVEPNLRNMGNGCMDPSFFRSERAAQLDGFALGDLAFRAYESFELPLTRIDIPATLALVANGSEIHDLNPRGVRPVLHRSDTGLIHAGEPFALGGLKEPDRPPIVELALAVADPLLDGACYARESGWRFAFWNFGTEGSPVILLYRTPDDPPFPERT